MPKIQVEADILAATIFCAVDILLDREYQLRSLVRLGARWLKQNVHFRVFIDGRSKLLLYIAYTVHHM